MILKSNFADASYIGKREEQQDYKANLILQKEAYVLYILADGMGGHVGGAIASKEVCKGFLNFFKTNEVGNNPEESLRLALKEANNRITNILREHQELNGMGSTVIALLHNQNDNSFSFISVGDSPLYLLSNGNLQRINQNHAYYDQLLEEVNKGLISFEDAKNHPSRHAITSAIMGKEIPLIDCRSGKLQKNELLLLASDGVQTLNDAPGGEIEAILNTSGDLIEKTNQIITAVKQKNDPYQDNTTLIIIEYLDVIDPKLANKILEATSPSSTTAKTKNIIEDNTEEIKNKKSNKPILYITVFITLAFIAGLSAVIFFKPNAEQAEKKPSITQPSSSSIMTTNKVSSPQKSESDALQSKEKNTEIAPNNQSGNVSGLVAPN